MEPMTADVKYLYARDHLRRDAGAGRRLHREAVGESIFTQADTWEELRTNAQEAVEAFFDQPRPDHIRLHLVRDEVPAIA
jgi:hypothetical protein